MTKEERNTLEATIYEKLQKMSREELEKLNDILDVLEKAYADSQK